MTSPIQFTSQILSLMARPPVGAADDRAWFASDTARGPVTLTSQHVDMTDGTRLAVDLYLPEGHTDLPLTAVLLSTRYQRRRALEDWLAPELVPLANRRLADAMRYCANGYAHVVVDARGSGASFGHRQNEFGVEECNDMSAIADWIVDQPWSDGQIVAAGTSYEGTTAELLAATGHQAVRAVVPRFALFDSFAEIVMPGGALLTRFMYPWAAMNAALDSNTAGTFMATNGGPMINALMAAGSSVAGVDADDDGVLLAQALAEHAANYDLTAQLRQIRFRDDVADDGWNVDALSAHAHVDGLRDSGAAVCSFSGWSDGAYPWGAIKRFVALGGNEPDSPHRLVLGPWDHGGMQNVDPTSDQQMGAFDQVGHHLRFFASHTGKPGGIPVDEARIHYYTMGERVWKTAESWPPQGFSDVALSLAPGGTLTVDAAADGTDAYTVDYRPTTLPGNRWASYANIGEDRIVYIDRVEQDAMLLTYDSAPLAEPLEVTGHPSVSIHLACSTPDTLVIAYLEEVVSDGRVHLVTEGLLRASLRAPHPDPEQWDALSPPHRFARADHQPLVLGDVVEVSFGLIPVSHQFAAGSCIRLALAGADTGTFERVPAAGGPPVWTVHTGPDHPSSVTLPVDASPIFGLR